MEQARELIARKEAIEAEIDAKASILKANDCNMQTPLVDSEGFPRADIDIYAVRGARVRIIELRNDLKEVMESISKALQGIYDPKLAPEPSEAESEALKPFAKVNAVSPGSPAADAGLEQGDLVLKFGHLTSKDFLSANLQPLAQVVAENENRHVIIRALHKDQVVYKTLIPRKGWGGPGMLGCHIVSYNSS